MLRVGTGSPFAREASDPSAVASSSPASPEVTVSPRPVAAADEPRFLALAGATAVVKTTSKAETGDVMKLVNANNARPVLYGDLWGEVAKFSSRKDLLNLREVSPKFSKFVDRSINSLKVSANNALGLLAAWGNAENLKNVKALHITSCNNEQLPQIIAALSAHAHATLDITLECSSSMWEEVDERGLAGLSNISPASLRLGPIDDITPGLSRVLEQVQYPLHLSGGRSDRLVQNEVLATLARIPQLLTLSVVVSEVSDQTAQALAQHVKLSELHLNTAYGIIISDDALTALAGSSTIHTLSVEETLHEVGAEVATAMAANTIVEHLNLGGSTQVFSASFAKILSTNKSLKTLRLPLIDGSGHLAKMPSLERLTLMGLISLKDATQFEKHAHLTTLTFENADFEDGALASIARSAVQDFVVPFNSQTQMVFTDTEVEAFFGNQTMRSLQLLFLPFVDTATSVAQTTRLAAHPGLTSLTVVYQLNDFEMDSSESGVPTVSQADLDAMSSAWGTNRAAGDFQMVLY